MRPYQVKKLTNISLYHTDYKLQTMIVLRNLDKMESTENRKQHYTFVTYQDKQSSTYTQYLQGLNNDQISLTSAHSLPQLQANLTTSMEQDNIQQINLITNNIDLIADMMGNPQVLASIKIKIKKVYYLYNVDEIEQFLEVCQQFNDILKQKYKLQCCTKQQFFKKCLEAKVHPNFLFFNKDSNKQLIQKGALNLMITQQFDYRIMLSSMEDYLKKNGLNNQILESFIKQRVNGRLPKGRAIHYYILESPIYKLTNNYLRKTTNPSQIFYLQPFIKDLFYDISNKHQEQQRKKKYQRFWEFTCYRGANFQSSQIESFKNNIGQCIECLGFLSTSMDQTIARSFQHNVLVRIQVNRRKRYQQTDYGFAYLQTDEKQVLFNMLNSFVIRKVQFNTSQQITYIDLQYGVLAEIIHKKNTSKDTINEEEQKIYNSSNIISEYTSNFTNESVLFSSYSLLSKEKAEIDDFRQYLSEQKQMLNQSENMTSYQVRMLQNFIMKGEFISRFGSIDEKENWVKEVEAAQLLLSYIDQQARSALKLLIKYLVAYVLYKLQQYQKVMHYTQNMIQQYNKVQNKFLSNTSIGTLIWKIANLRFLSLTMMQKLQAAFSEMSKIYQILKSYPQTYKSMQLKTKNYLFMMQKDEKQRLKKMRNYIQNMSQANKYFEDHIPALCKLVLNRKFLERTDLPSLNMYRLIIQVSDIYTKSGICQQLDQLYAKIQTQIPKLVPMLDNPNFCTLISKFADCCLQTRNFTKCLKTTTIYLSAKQKVSYYDTQLINNYHRLCKLLIKSNNFQYDQTVQKMKKIMGNSDSVGSDYKKIIQECIRDVQCLYCLRAIMNQEEDADQVVMEMLEQKEFGVHQQKIYKHIDFLLMDNRDDIQSNNTQVPQNPSTIAAQSHQNQAIVEISIGSNNSNQSTQPVTYDNVMQKLQECEAMIQNQQFINTFKKLKQINVSVFEESDLEENNVEVVAMRSRLLGACLEGQGEYVQAKEMFEVCIQKMRKYPIKYLQQSLQLNKKMTQLQNKIQQTINPQQSSCCPTQQPTPTIPTIPRLPQQLESPPQTPISQQIISINTISELNAHIQQSQTEVRNKKTILNNPDVSKQCQCSIF